MINIEEKSKCCGCSACASVCPKQCIKMESDIEGFLYPQVDAVECIDCGLCEKVCPVINTGKDSEQNTPLYILQNKDDKVRSESTSGGAFTPIAEYVLSKGGAVYGVGFKDNDEYYVCHQEITDKNELLKLRSSKYVQSDINDTYRMAQKQLKDDKWVCFSGTPCQIAGLKRFLRREYEKLITVDVVCRAVPSPLVWKKYVEYQKKQFNNEIERFRFRDKFYGYSYSTLSVYAKKNSGRKDYHRGIESDLMLRMFFSGVSIRPSCFDCKYRNNHESDFTIWDCFTVGKIAPEFDDNKGTTRMKINTEKGKLVFEQTADSYRYKQLDSSIKQKKEVAYAEKHDNIRDNFFRDLNEYEPEAVFNKYFPYTMKIRVLHMGRHITYRLGIYKFIKKIWDKFKIRKYS